jgi:1-aminocyclopropane-1-carboxylate deaminase/D-cysteine desulfhydrase-like pyridoxal-dependent ACC family enzyme
MSLRRNTPVEEYPLAVRVSNVPVRIRGPVDILVKREDLCCDPPGPPFAKVRGLLIRLQNLKRQGLHTIGYMENSISMNGWGVAWTCAELGMQAVIYDPQYNCYSEVLDYHRKLWKELGALIRTNPGGVSKVDFAVCRDTFEKEFGPNATLLYPGLSFIETVIATAEEVERTIKRLKKRAKTVVVNVGSGIIAAGIWRGFEKHCPDVIIHGIMGHSGDLTRKMNDIEKNSGLLHQKQLRSKFVLHDPGWKYTEPSEVPSPFPCNQFYDLKAWEWLVQNFHRLDEPILFWNIGA